MAIIAEIYDVTGREQKKDENISSKDLVEAIKKRMQNRGGPTSLNDRTLRGRTSKIKNIFYARDLAETKKLLLKIIQPKDVVLIMGAGDIYKITKF